MVIRNNLPPESQPWAREVDLGIKANSAAIERLAQDNRNAFKGLNSSMKVISEQIAQLAEVTEGLVVVTNTLTQQQATLSAQQAALTEAFVELEDLSANQVTGATATNGTASVISISAGNDYEGASVTVPTGYTRAVVSAVSNVAVSGSGPLLRGRTRINGSYGVEGMMYSGSASDDIGSGSSSHATTLTGLSAGSSITAWFNVTQASSVSGAYIMNTLTAIFLK